MEQDIFLSSASSKPTQGLHQVKKELVRTSLLLDLLCKTFYSAELTVEEKHASG